MGGVVGHAVSRSPSLLVLALVGCVPGGSVSEMGGRTAAWCALEWLE
jgi:hypothetical protein